MGYNAAEELNNRIMENIKRKEKEKNLRINSYLWRDNMYYIGVDLGGTKIAAGLVTEEGKLISKKYTHFKTKKLSGNFKRHGQFVFGNY